MRISRVKICLPKSRSSLPFRLIPLIESHQRMSFLFSSQMVFVIFLRYQLMFAGITECLESQQLVDIIRYHISLGATPAQACTFICDICTAPSAWQKDRKHTRGSDNMTIIIAALLHGKEKTAWMQWISERTKASKTPSDIPQLYPGMPLVRHPACISPDFDYHIQPPTVEPLKASCQRFRVR